MEGTVKGYGYPYSQIKDMQLERRVKSPNHMIQVSIYNHNLCMHHFDFDTIARLWFLLAMFGLMLIGYTRVLDCLEKNPCFVMLRNPRTSSNNCVIHVPSRSRVFPGFPGVSRSLPIFQEFSRKRLSHV